MSTGYLILTLVVGPLVGGGVVYYIQSRIRVKEARDTAAIHGEATATQTPVQVLTQQLLAKDAQLAQWQGQHHAFVESTMKRQDATTQAILALAEQIRVQTGNLSALQNGLQEHRAESSARAGKIYEQVGKVNERLAGLEANVKTCLETASDAAKAAKEAAELAEKAVDEARAT